MSLSCGAVTFLFEQKEGLSLSLQSALWQLWCCDFFEKNNKKAYLSVTKWIVKKVFMTRNCGDVTFLKKQ